MQDGWWADLSVAALLKSRPYAGSTDLDLVELGMDTGALASDQQQWEESVADQRGGRVRRPFSADLASRLPSA